MNSDGLHRAGTLGFHGFGQLLRFKNCFFKGSDFFYGLDFQGYGYGCFIGFLVTVSQGLDGTGFFKGFGLFSFSWIRLLVYGRLLSYCFCNTKKHSYTQLKHRPYYESGVVFLIGYIVIGKTTTAQKNLSK